ncbi:FHA domain-containing protein [Phanerochaete sordida]|uniref:FHA domain-containing protein n=1 Tax=Phanerochaete sordida TaxID=48140 RepID=A0A9P3G165_9APHY|nr:FHA domain-containing protein [Phanerochaete sordida]
MDASEVGRFGTLRLMKRLEPDKIVASYPIDEEEITFGRDPSCSIRLYYESVSGLHCKIVFHERKAFVVVLGVNGVVIDGCPVFPANNASSGPVTVPLPNNSTIEVHKKRFQFSYPPKELRETLINTPSKHGDSTPDRRRRRRTLRMSMIQSAQVFTPRPSHDPRENLRILKTPIKSPFRSGSSPMKRRESSPLKRGAFVPEDIEEEDEEDEDIVLVESNHPRVVEEDRDLVILEHVVAREPEPEPEPEEQRGRVQYPIPQSDQQAMQTPHRRQNSRPSLHRAVLMRSAHRTAMRREMEIEDEREAEEVEEIFEKVEQMQDLRGEGEDENREEQQERTPRATSGWRKSLDIGGNEEEHAEEQVVPEDKFAEGEEPEDRLVADQEDETQPGGDEEYDEEYQEEYQEEDYEEEVQEDEDAMDLEEAENHYEPPMPPPVTTVRGPFAVPQRSLGKFMTPQAPRQGTFAGFKSKSRGHARYSVGGFTPGGIYGTGSIPETPGSSHGISGPRRVRLVEPWKVDEITVPLNDADEHQQEEQEEEPSAPRWLGTPRREALQSPSKREKLSEAERKAILQRRKSLLTEPDFFDGQTPGRRLSLFPPLSPMKSPAKLSAPAFEPEQLSSTSHNPLEASEDGREDTSVLLARMKHMVEDAKRRQSLGPRPSFAGGAHPTPRKSSGGFSLLAPDGDSTPVRQVFVEDTQSDDEDVSDKENDGAPPQSQSMDSGEEYEGQEDVHMASGDEDAPRFAEPHASAMETPRMDGLKHMFGGRAEATPSFRGVREMFSRRAQDAALETPRLEGVRQMFTRAEGVAAGSSRARGGQQVPATPAFEGVGAMMETPAAYRPVRRMQEPEQEEVEQSLEEHEEHPEEQPEEVMEQPDEDQEQHSEEETAVPTPKPRTRKPSSQQKTPGARRTSPRNVPPPEPTIQEPELPTVDEDDVEPTPASRVTKKPRSRSKAPESDTDHDAEPPAPKRRTRKTSASPAPEEPGTATRTLRSRTKTPTPQPEDGPAPAPRTRRRARTPIAEEDEEDPIDSIPRAASPEVPLPEDVAPPAKPESRVKRSGKGKFVLEVKEEEEDEFAAPLAPPEPKPATRGTSVPRAVRGRRPGGAGAATTASLARTSSIPRSSTAATRGAKTATGPLRRPATMPKGATEVRNKENTHDEDEPERPAAARTVSRIARGAARTAPSRTRAPSVDLPEKPEVGKSRVSRTKTTARK